MTTETKSNKNAASAAAVLDEMATPIQIQQAEVPLEELARKIKGEHDAVVKLHELSLVHARNAGEYLYAAQSVLKFDYKKWLSWAKTFLRLSESTVANYVRIFKKWDTIPKRKELNYSEALKALRKSRKQSDHQKPEAALSPSQTVIQDRMKQFKVKGKIGDVEKFLESFGVQWIEDKK